MRPILTVIFFILIIRCSAQDTSKYVSGGTFHSMVVGVKTKGKYNGLVTTFHSYGNDSIYKTYSKTYFINGKNVGPDSTFNEKGEIWKVYQYLKNSTYFICFHDNGKVNSFGFMKNNEKKFGEWVSFYENGQLESVLNYSNNNENGDAIYLYSNGQLQSTGKFSDGYKKGKWIESDSSGTNTSYGNYKPVAIDRSENDSVNVIPDSISYPKYTNIIVMWTDYGVKTGVWITYNKIDKSICRQKYVNGKLVK